MEPVKGHLEVMDSGFGFLRSIENNFKPGMDNTYVSNGMISKFGLREGCFIEGFADKKIPGKKNLALTSIERINNLSIDEFSNVQSLQEQTSINPFEKYTLARDTGDITGKAIDIIAPLGKGQRGLIIAPPKSGKTTILKDMANSIVENHPDTIVFILLVDERPEEVTDFQRGVEGAHVLYSSADQQTDQHMRMTRLALHAAINCVEAGNDAIVFIDSLTRMTRAFNKTTNNHGKTLTGGLGANAMEFPRKIFGAARKLENGGSLTIIATILIDTGSRMDDIIYQEFKGTGNMDLVLSQECAENRIWPAINVDRSGTRKEELLLSEDEYKEAIKIRRGLPRDNDLASMSKLVEHLSL
ncbi:MAG: transcription termination factor Rho [Desulfobacterales bacterium]|nr:transcription termination factor Rho [Desulfobacterales bacterium]